VGLIVLGRGWVGGLVCRVRREDRYFFGEVEKLCGVDEIIL